MSGSRPLGHQAHDEWEERKDTAEPKKGSGTSQPGTGELEWPVKERGEIRNNVHVPTQVPEGLSFLFMPVDDIFPAAHRNLF